MCVGGPDIYHCFSKEIGGIGEELVHGKIALLLFAPKEDVDTGSSNPPLVTIAYLYFWFTYMIKFFFWHKHLQLALLGLVINRKAVCP